MTLNLLKTRTTVNSRHFRVYIIQVCYRPEVLLLPTKYFSKKGHRTVLKRREEKLAKYSKCDKFVFTELLQSKYDAAIPQNQYASSSSKQIQETSGVLLLLMVEDYERVMRNRLITLQVISFESHVFVLQSPCQHFIGTWSNNTQT